MHRPWVADGTLIYDDAPSYHRHSELQAKHVHYQEKDTVHDPTLTPPTHAPRSPKATVNNVNKVHVVNAGLRRTVLLSGRPLLDISGARMGRQKSNCTAHLKAPRTRCTIPRTCLQDGGSSACTDGPHTIICQIGTRLSATSHHSRCFILV